MIQKDPDRRPPLGEIRRILGMQLSRLGFRANTLDGFAQIASSPFISPLAATMPMPAMQVAPRPVPRAEPPVEENKNQVVEAGGPPWFFYVAVAVLIVVVALIVVLK